MTRDIALLVLLALLIVAVSLLYLKLSAVLNSAKRSVRNVEDVVSTVSDKVVKPAVGSGVASKAGKAAIFILGLVRRRSKGGPGDDEK